jgi:hypothetical protein
MASPTNLPAEGRRALGEEDCYMTKSLVILDGGTNKLFPPRTKIAGEEKRLMLV